MAKLQKKHKTEISHIEGFERTLSDFNEINVINYQVDPAYGYDHVIMALIEFVHGGMYGLCIYDSRRQEFIEEPGYLEDYGFRNLQALYNKYPRLKRVKSL